jgi:acyl-homoserine lactone acylase PvdQ
MAPPTLRQFISYLSITALSVSILGAAYYWACFIPVRDGRLFLTKAFGQSTLLRERDTGIHHIRADTLQMAVYTQGFAHA